MANAIDTETGIDATDKVTDDQAKGNYPHGRAAGDWNDDDAGYIDDILTPDPNLPAIPSDPALQIEQPTKSRPHVTRLIGRSISLISIANGGGSVQLFTADPNRVSLRLMVITAQAIGAVTDGVMVGGEKSECDSGAAAWYQATSSLTGTQAPIVYLDGHTGAVWVKAAHSDNSDPTLNVLVVAQVITK